MVVERTKIRFESVDVRILNPRFGLHRLEARFQVSNGPFQTPHSILEEELHRRVWHRGRKHRPRSPVGKRANDSRMPIIVEESMKMINQRKSRRLPILRERVKDSCRCRRKHPTQRARDGVHHRRASEQQKRVRGRTPANAKNLRTINRTIQEDLLEQC
jgi:hypothetical protein